MNSQYKINEKQYKCKILTSTNSLKLYLNIFIFYEDFNSTLSFKANCLSTWSKNVIQLWGMILPNYENM